MVRLRSPQQRPARNFFSGRERWRLLALFISLGLVVVIMNRLRRPEVTDHLEWWMLGGGAAPAEVAEKSAVDVFRATPAANESGAEQPTVFPSVNHELLATVRDNTYFRAAESDAWFHLLEILQNLPQTELTAASTGQVDYVQLAQQPHVYRGRLVTVRGTVRQVTEERPVENKLGISSYYRLVIQSHGGGIWPIFVYALELPDGFPRGATVAQPVEVTGFFFKDLSYAWAEGVGIAPVLLAKGVEWPVVEAAGATGSASDSEGSTSSLAKPVAHPRLPLAADDWTGGDEEKLVGASTAVPTLRELLALAGWDNARWAGFDDGAPLSDDQRQSLVSLLRRLQTFHSFSLNQWAKQGPSWEMLISRPAEHRGDVVALVGRVRRVERVELPPGEAARLELGEYFVCHLELADGHMAEIVAARVPKAWLGMEPLDEPASAAAVFIKTLPEDTGQQAALFVAPRVSWHPTQASPGVAFGKSVLGTLGMDVGALDDIKNRDKVLSSERDAFYEMLAAVGHIGANQLIRFAQNNLPAVEDNWAAVAERLAHDEKTAASAADRARYTLANEVLRQAAIGKYSVAPLFNEPDAQIGELLVLDGVARRAVRIDVGMAPDGQPSDVRERFGFGHYYELELFTSDSQNYPIVVCVRELPAGFPTGPDIRELVRVPGFFFKTWLYHTRKVGDGEGGNLSDAEARRQFAPMLIGPAPVWLRPEETTGSYAGLVGSGLFVLAFAAICAATWWYARGDRRFHDRVLARNYALPEGQSLDDLEVPADKPPAESVEK